MRTIAIAIAVAFAFVVTHHAAGQGRDPRQQAQEVRGVIKSVEAGSITLSFPEGRESSVDKSYKLAKEVEVAIATGIGANFGRGGFFKEGRLTDLAAGIVVSLSLSADMKSVESIAAEGPIVRGILKGTDAKKKTLTITAPAQREAPAEDKTYALAADAEIIIDDGRGRRFSFKEGKFDELADGAIVTLRLTIDKQHVQSVQAEGSLITGTLKSVDPAKKSITLATRPGRGDDAPEERTLVISSDAAVLVDDGRGRRLSLKAAKLADLPIGGLAMIKLSVDQAFAMMVRVEGPMVMGLFKAADADKGTITIAIPKGRDDADEKTFTLVKGALVNFDGAESNLGNIKAGDNGTFVQLRLSLDQKTVQSVIARQNRRDR